MIFVSCCLCISLPIYSMHGVGWQGVYKIPTTMCIFGTVNICACCSLYVYLSVLLLYSPYIWELIGSGRSSMIVWMFGEDVLVEYMGLPSIAVYLSIWGLLSIAVYLSICNLLHACVKIKHMHVCVNVKHTSTPNLCVGIGTRECMRVFWRTHSHTYHIHVSSSIFCMIGQHTHYCCRFWATAVE